jgi:hypothetical protein
MATMSRMDARTTSLAIGLLVLLSACSSEQPPVGPVDGGPRHLPRDAAPCTFEPMFEEARPGCDDPTCRYCVDAERAFVEAQERLSCCAAPSFTCIRGGAVWEGAERVAEAYATARSCSELIDIMEAPNDWIGLPPPPPQ